MLVKRFKGNYNQQQMLHIKYKVKSILAILGLIWLAIFAIPPLAPKAQAAVPGCAVGESASTQNCSDTYIQSEINRRCTTGADRRVECAERTRQSILDGDYDYNGTPDAETQSDPVGGGECGNLDTDAKKERCGCKRTNLDSGNCTIVAYLTFFIRVLSGLVGIVVITMVIVGGVQYTTSRGDPQAVAAARTRITNAVLALVFYLFIFAFLQWLVPGGVL